MRTSQFVSGEQGTEVQYPLRNEITTLASYFTRSKVTLTTIIDCNQTANLHHITRDITLLSTPPTPNCQMIHTNSLKQKKNEYKTNNKRKKTHVQYITRLLSMLADIFFLSQHLQITRTSPLYVKSVCRNFDSLARNIGSRITG